jgi:hypothetical protein
MGEEGVGKFGFIDEHGKFAVDPQFEQTLAFSEGLAAIRTGDDKTGKYGYIGR